MQEECVSKARVLGPYKKETLVVMKLIKEEKRKRKKKPEKFQFFTEISTRFGVKVQWGASDPQAWMRKQPVSWVLGRSQEGAHQVCSPVCVKETRVF